MGVNEAPVDRTVKHPGRPGSPHYYSYLKCRCEECVQTRNAAQRSYAAKRSTAEPRKPVEHGTQSMYRRHKCRCEKCREANRLGRYYDKNGNLREGRKPPRPWGPYGESQKPVRAAPVVKAVRKVEPAPKQKTSRPKALRVVAMSEKTRPAVQASIKFESEPVDICGLETETGAYCRKLLPCSRPEHQET